VSQEVRFSPFPGLRAYSSEDVPLFFGREAERRIISENLQVAPITVMYGPAGVGKSSILRAAVLPHLREHAPEFLPVYFRDWRTRYPAGALAQTVRDAATALEGHLEDDRDALLTQTLQRVSRSIEGGVLLILDQFEEYLLFGDDDAETDGFAAQFAEAMNRPDVHAHALISIDEDSLARLDRFKGRIRGLFDNTIRIEHLTEYAARQAILGPIEQFNRTAASGTAPVSIADDLVDTVLMQVRTTELTRMSATGQRMAAGRVRIEAPYLQLVMSRLWEQTRHRGSNVLELETLHELGGSQRIVSTHIDAALSRIPIDEQHIAAALFGYLVTPSGVRLALSANDLAAYTQLPPENVQRVLDRLTAGDIRVLAVTTHESARLYEITSDVLIAPITAWRERHGTEREDGEALSRVHRLASERHATADRVRVFKSLAILFACLWLLTFVVLLIAWRR
jgi:hypothetical protein